MKKKETNLVTTAPIDALYQDACQIIETARSNAVRSVDFCRVQMYWYLGKRIFEEEQHGKERADYGTYLIKNLSSRLKPDYGSGFGPRQLERARAFYRLYPRGCVISLFWQKLLFDYQIVTNRKMPIFGLLTHPLELGSI